jgi:hypothetical protein
MHLFLQLNSFFRKCNRCSWVKQKLQSNKRRLCRTLQREKSLKSLLCTLKGKKLIDDGGYSVLKHSFSGLTFSILENEMINKNRKAPGRRYRDEIAKFAITLHFYSPAAYKFVRSVLHLPHESTIRQWSSSVSTTPGILRQVFEVIGKLVQKDRNAAECSLLCDEMNIKKNSDWNQYK